MDLGLTEAQEILKTTAADFVQQEYPKETLIALEMTPTGMTPELFRQVASWGGWGLSFRKSTAALGGRLRTPRCSLRNSAAAQCRGRIFLRASWEH